jgi:hypothetical protein
MLLLTASAVLAARSLAPQAVLTTSVSDDCNGLVSSSTYLQLHMLNCSEEVQRLHIDLFSRLCNYMTDVSRHLQFLLHVRLARPKAVLLYKCVDGLSLSL